MQLYSTLYFVAVNTFMSNIMNTILVFQSERPVFLREQANHMYGVFSYFMAKTLTDIPIMILTPMITTVLLYFVLNLSLSVENFFGFYLVLFLTANAASSIGFLVSSLFENEVQAQTVSSLMILPFMLFGGLLSNNKSIFDWLSWFQYISPIKYCAEALVDNEFRNDKYGIGDDLKDHLDYIVGYGRCVIIFIALIIGFRALAFVVFRMLIRKFQ